MTEQTKYPFKFLDAYAREDRDIFFGRDEEVEALYQMVFQTDLILVYGASGTGKTSLIQCGLASKFQPYEWLALSIRRGDNLNESLEKALAAYDDPETTTPSSDNFDWLTDTGESPAQAPESPAARRLKNLYLRHFKPVFLIFDQFEELYILGTKAEQNRFVDTVREILRIEQPVKVLLSIREEYLGYLYEFERKVPELLRKKLRIEPMNLEKVQTVVQGISRLPYSNVHLQHGAEAAIGAGIFDKLKERENVLSIELPYLQVFLDKLYLQITGDRSRQAPAEITLDALRQMGDIGDVLRNFLDDQVQENARALGVPPDTIKKLLSPFVTLDGTKEPLSADQLHARLPELDTPFIARSLQAFQNSRILRFDEKEQRYEVAHDSLARQIATYQDAEDIALQKAAQMIRTQMLLDADRREVFSEKQLLFMEPYLPKLELSGEEQAWLKHSRAHWEAENRRIQRENEEKLEAAQRQAEQERQLREESEKQRTIAQENEARARTRTRLALVVSLIALILALFAGWSYNQAEIKTKETAEALEKVEQEKAATEEQRRIAEKKTKEAEANLQLADDNLKKAQSEEARAKAALEQVEKEKAATEEQRLLAEDNLIKAKIAIEEAERQKINAQNTLDNLNKANEAFVLRFLENARKDMKDGRVDDAYDKIQAAQGLGVLQPEVCKAYLANADSCLLDPDSAKYEIAKTSIDSALAIGALDPLDIGNAYMRITKNYILNLQYDTALKSARAAETLKVIHPDTIKNLYLEVVFWYTESRNTQRAAGILDTLTARTGYAAARKLLQNLPADSADAVRRLREVLQKIDAGQYERLQRRYYPVMVSIPGGKFRMGCDTAKDPDCGGDETPHEQEVRDFEMARTETTVWQFGLFCAATGREIDRYIYWPNSGDNPVVNVSWFDAAAYANWVSRQKGLPDAYQNKEEEWVWTSNSSFRLPTEAEWEYAAGGGAGSRTKYAGTNDEEQLKDFAWYDENSGDRTRSVGKRKANLLGLHDMSGNVWEWCWDWYQAYPTDQKPNYKGPETGSNRVRRGGSWRDLPQGCRVSNRGRSPYNRRHDLGFRLARTP